MPPPAPWYPTAARRPIPNTASPHPGEPGYLYEVAGPFTAAPLGWVLHVVVGDGSPYATFVTAKSPSRRFSHLWFAKDGRVEQYGPLTHKSWAQGTGNGLYVSCETEGVPTEALTDAQVRSLAEFHVWAGFPDVLASAPGQPGIGTHYMGGADWGGHSCPDPGPGGQGPRSHQRAAILAAATAIRAGQPPEDDMPLTQADAELVARAVHNQRLGSTTVTIGAALDDLRRRPSAATAADIAAAITPTLVQQLTAAVKALPAGTAALDDATVSRVAQATATELAVRLTR